MSLHLLYGGTFDPIHLGHLAVAHAALATSCATHLDFVPAADPPHRAPPGAGFDDRADLVELALAAEPPPLAGTWAIDRREGQRAGPSFTVDTLREWRAEHGAVAPLGFVMGADAFLGLEGWREWGALFDLAHLLVARRPGVALDALPDNLASACDTRWAIDAAELRDSPAGRVFIVDLPLRDESATAVRRALGQGDHGAGDASPDHRPRAPGLPAAVAERIAARGLYRDGPRT